MTTSIRLLLISFVLLEHISLISSRKDDTMSCNSITSSFLNHLGVNCYELPVPNNTVQCINNKNFKSDDDTSGGGPCILVERICTLKEGNCEYLTQEKSNHYECSLNEFNKDCVGKLKYCNQIQELGEKSCYDFPVETEGYGCANNIDSNDKPCQEMELCEKKIFQSGVSAHDEVPDEVCPLLPVS